MFSDLVFSLSENRANRSNDDDVKKLLRLSCHNCFERLRFFKIDVP